MIITHIVTSSILVIIWIISHYNYGFVFATGSN